MKNQASFPKAHELAAKLLEVFSKLQGNSKSFDPMIEGIHEVVVTKAVERLSAKGKEMKEINFRSLKDGRDATLYVMKFRKMDWKKWENVELGSHLIINYKLVNGFANVDILENKGMTGIVNKPNVALTNQTIYIYDIEIFKKDELFVFRDYFTKEWIVINNDLDALRQFYLKNRDSLFIGYNNSSYDDNVMRAVLQGKNGYHISKTIISSDDRAAQYKMYNMKKTPLFSMDLYQDNRGFSLKEWSAFLGINIKETEVDFDMERELTEDEKIKNILYCKNDVLATELRFEQNISMLLAKVVLAGLYKLDKKSISMTNANLTATILGSLKHEDRGDERDFYEIPAGFKVENELVLENMTGELPDKIAFTVNHRDLDVDLGEGGIHGAKQSYINVDEDHIHSDVTSLHPSSMTLFNYESRNIPESNKGVYKSIIEKRVEAKHNAGNIVEVKGVKVPGWVLDMGLKLPLNGTYGTMGASFNANYDPRQRLLVCIVGQLGVVDLIEKITPHATVTQTNTDAVDYIPFSEEDRSETKKIIQDWESRTGYGMDSEIYVEMFQKDINNYIQRMEDGSVNVKGAIGLNRGQKISKAVVSNAFINYLVSGKDYREYIEECQDLRQFQIITKTGWTYDETIVRDGEGNESKAQKVNRVFATNDPDIAVELFKVKRGAVIEDLEEGTTIVGDDSYTVGLPKAPEMYTISNEAVGEGITLDKVDKEYYIREVEDTLELWFGSQWRERIEEARKRGDKRNGKIEVREYITG